MIARSRKHATSPADAGSTDPPPAQEHALPLAGSSPWRRRRLLLVLILGLLAIAGGLAFRLAPGIRERRLAALPIGELADRARSSPRDSVVLCLYGEALLRDGSAKDASEQFRSAIEADAGMTRAYTGLGRSLAALHRPQAAEVVFQQAMKLDPRDAEPHFYLAKVYFDGGRPLQAVPDLEAAARLKPGDANIWYTLGQVYARAFKRDAALAALERAVKLDGSQPEYWRDLGRAYWDYGRLDEAERCFQRALASRRDDPILLIWLGQVYLQRPDTPENRRLAEETYRRCIRVSPEMGEAHLKLGELLLRAERYPEAERELRQAVKLSPEQDQALFQLGQVLVRLGRTSEGEKYLKAFEELKRLGSSIETLKDQIAHSPRDPELRLRLARLYRRYESFPDAEREYTAYLALKPEDAAARRELEQCRRGAGGRPAVDSLPAPRP